MLTKSQIDATKSQIDAIVAYVANHQGFRHGAWFSVKDGHGWSEFNCIDPAYFEPKTISAFDWAARLGFLQCSSSGGSCCYTIYRLTESGRKYADEILSKHEDH
jgi:hypothetical protein